MGRITIGHFVKSSLKPLINQGANKNEMYLPIYCYITYKRSNINFKSRFYKFRRTDYNFYKIKFIDNYVLSSYCDGRNIINQSLLRELERERNYVELLIEKYPFILEDYQGFELFENKFNSELEIVNNTLSSFLFEDKMFGLKKMFAEIEYPLVFQMLRRDLSIEKLEVPIKQLLYELTGYTKPDYCKEIIGKYDYIFRLAELFTEFNYKWLTDRNLSQEQILLTRLEWGDKLCKKAFSDFAAQKLLEDKYKHIKNEHLSIIEKTK